MPSLSVIDLAMFLLETPRCPLNIGPLVLLRPPKDAGQGFADRLHERMMEHPPGPPFNYQLNISLTSLPTVEPMTDIDLSAHVHRLTLKGEGTLDQLIAEVCELHEAPLPREGLLWQFYVIDGLADGRVALYGKVHHGIIDGRGFVQAVTHWFSTDPDDEDVRALWQGAPDKSASRRKREDRKAAPGGLLAMLKKTYGALGSAAALGRMVAGQGLRHIGLGDKALDLPFINVPNALGGETSPRRNYAFVTLPLADVKALGKALDATVNDILLVALDIALNRYLGTDAGREDKPLVVDMPVALPGADGGNQIAVLQLAMGRPSATHRQRLAAIRHAASRVKNVVKDASAETVMLYTTLVHGVPAIMDRVGIRRTPLVSNLMFSNPFGLATRQYLMGAEVELILPISLLIPGQMLNVTVVTLADRLQIGFLGIPGIVDRIDELARNLDDAWVELKTELTPPLALPPPDGKKAAVRKSPRKPRARVAIKRAAEKPVAV